jgi:hypothetical protein
MDDDDGLPIDPSHPNEIAEFKTELARLIKKGLTAGLSSDDIADELTEAAEAWRTDEYDPVGDVIASHRP